MKKILVVLMCIIVVPFIITNFFYEYKVNKITSGFNSNKEEIKIRVLTNNNIETMNLEDYLIGVVSSEVPIYFENEAIKAQAVAARTYALKQIENRKGESYDITDDTSSQVYQSDEQLRKNWQEKYEEYVNKIKNCIEETRGEYITYNDEIIYAFFFSTSNGKTEDNKNVFGKDLPYLKVVDSSFDAEETDNFLVTKKFSLSEFYNLLDILYKDTLNVTNIIKTESGRISSININGNTFTGRNFQKLLSLRSNDFDLTQEENDIIITTRGYGHGVGMSQYGANALAKKNKDYQEILKYYYQGTKIQKL